MLFRSEGECLAVVYGLQKCKYFLLGCRNLVIATDHKPLVNILNDRYLGDIENKRLMKLKEKTLEFHFTIEHVPGKKHIGPDTMSRYPVGDAIDLKLQDEMSQCTKKEVRNDIVNGLAIIEVAGVDENVAVTTETERQVSQMVQGHAQSCCTCTETSWSSYSAINWDAVKQIGRAHV